MRLKKSLNYNQNLVFPATLENIRQLLNKGFNSRQPTMNEQLILR